MVGHRMSAHRYTARIQVSRARLMKHYRLQICVRSDLITEP